MIRQDNDKTRQSYDKTITRQDNHTRHDKTRQDNRTRQDKRQDKTKQSKARQDKTRRVYKTPTMARQD